MDVIDFEHRSSITSTITFYSQSFTPFQFHFGCFLQPNPFMNLLQAIKCFSFHTANYPTITTTTYFEKKRNSKEEGSSEI
jgi:hypothetical protein